MPLSLMPVLERHEVERIHEHSLELLQRVGIDYRTPRALEILERRGCKVDYQRNWASLSRDVVEWAIEQAPRVVHLEARDPARGLILDGQRTHHTTDSQGCKALDFETGECRPSRAEDLRRGLLLADALDKIDIVHAMVAANDVPAHVRTIRHFALAFKHTSKHVRSGVLDAGQVPFLVEMVRAVTGSAQFRPIFSAVDCTISPLMHDGPMTEACIELAKLGVPILMHPMPLAGGTSPVTPGGTILLHNVEFLSGLVLFQAANPGTPTIYAAGAAQLDMTTGCYRNSANGNAMRLALAELAHFYELPVNLMGLSTSSSALDALYGYEATTACLLSHLARADEIYSMGLLGSSQILSLDKLVLDNHLTREVEIMVRSVQVDEEHLQADLIERVGIGRHYLKEPQTLAWTRKEYVPVWPPAGQEIIERVHEEAAEILRAHRPPALPDGAEERLEAIVAEADRKLARTRVA